MLEMFKLLRNKKKIILNLAKNDFKARFSGSMLGGAWGIITPMITILIYWFVFEIGFRAANPVENLPFIVWLVAGLIPWFWISEAIGAYSFVFYEYSYLVKKVSFDFEILPVMKVISNLFVHLVFVIILMIIMVVTRTPFSIYFLQIFYYIPMTFAYLVSLSWLISSITGLYKDFGHVISIVMQVNFWLLAIVWNFNVIGMNYRIFFKLNPVFYIIEGYRDLVIGGVWFWEKPWFTFYFMLMLIFNLFLSVFMFEKLRDYIGDSV